MTNPELEVNQQEMSVEALLAHLKQIHEDLGFAENSDLTLLRDAAYEAALNLDIDARNEVITLYEIAGESIVEEHVGEPYVFAQIGLVIATASANRHSGNFGAYLDDILAAHECARQMYLDELTTKLEGILSYEIALILKDLGDESSFDSETCTKIRELPFKDAFEAAYRMLLQAGLDPDIILSDFIESEF